MMGTLSDFKVSCLFLTIPNLFSPLLQSSLPTYFERCDELSNSRIVKFTFLDELFSGLLDRIKSATCSPSPDLSKNRSMAAGGISHYCTTNSSFAMACMG